MQITNQFQILRSITCQLDRMLKKTRILITFLCIIGKHYIHIQMDCKICSSRTVPMVIILLLRDAGLLFSDRALSQKIFPLISPDHVHFHTNAVIKNKAVLLGKKAFPGRPKV